MGKMELPVKTFLREMDISVIPPPQSSQKTLKKGKEYAPEFACLPFKINLGNYMEAAELGADSILMGGGFGPCRFGFYGELQKYLLQEAGYEMEMYILEKNIFHIKDIIKELSGNFSLTKMTRSFHFTWSKIKVMDKLTEKLYNLRGQVVNKEKVENDYNKLLKKLDEAETYREIDLIEQEIDNFLQIDNAVEKKLTIALVGEIYTVLEPFTNIDLARKLNYLDVSVYQTLTLSHWLKNFFTPGSGQKKLVNKAAGYINSFVGGHGLNSISDIYSLKDKVDGVVHIMPFTCMPEIVARAIIPEVIENENIPVLSLIFDEHTAEAGVKTRLEAFIDLIKYNKAR